MYNGIVIAGATAVGKTALSIELAKKLDAVIISADAMQVYKKMNIGTSKITSFEMQGIKHYMLDVVEPDEHFDVGMYYDMVNDILKKEKKMEVFLFLKEDDRDIKKYIQEELEISPSEADILLEMIGKNPFKVRNEVDKIKVYLNGEKFEIGKIKNIVSVQKEYRIYEMTENIFSGKAQEVIDYLETTKEYMGILYQLYNELEMMYKLSSLKESGRNISSQYNVFKAQFEEIKEVFKSNGRIPNYYSVFKKIEKLRKYSNRNLKKLVFRCWEIEKDIKTGKMAMETGVELLIMEIVSCYGKK